MNIHTYLIKKIAAQGNVRTFSDNFLLVLLNNMNQLSHKDCSSASRWYEWKILEGKRFTKADEPSLPRPELADTYMYFSQGFTDCMTWKGKPILKTTYDMAILHMLLWELKPKTIIEIGSGSGASAEYMKDTTEAFGLDTTIYSFDIAPPATTDRIQFLYADCNDLDTFRGVDYSKLPHPWLIVEDAHVNTLEVLKFFNTFLVSGDYLFVEDTETKQHDLKTLMEGNGDLMVDRKYVDYFGPNMTCATNGILKCL